MKSESQRKALRKGEPDPSNVASSTGCSEVGALPWNDLLQSARCCPRSPLLSAGREKVIALDFSSFILEVAFPENHYTHYSSGQVWLGIELLQQLDRLVLAPLTTEEAQPFKYKCKEPPCPFPSFVLS